MLFQKVLRARNFAFYTFLSIDFLRIIFNQYHYHNSRIEKWCKATTYIHNMHPKTANMVIRKDLHLLT